MANISGQELNNIFKQADQQGISRNSVISGLKAKGHTLEGYSGVDESLGKIKDVFKGIRDARQVQRKTPEFDIGKMAQSAIGGAANMVGGAIQGAAQNFMNNPAQAITGAVGAATGQSLPNPLNIDFAKAGQGAFNAIGQGAQKIGSAFSQQPMQTFTGAQPQDIQRAEERLGMQPGSFGQLPEDQQLEQYKRAQNLEKVGGVTDIARGALDIAFSPIAGLVQGAPKPVQEGLKPVGEAYEGAKNFVIGSTGIDPESPEGKLVSTNVDNILDILGFKGAKSAKAISKTDIARNVAEATARMPSTIATKFKTAVDDLFKQTKETTAVVDDLIDKAENAQRLSNKTLTNLERRLGAIDSAKSSVLKETATNAAKEVFAKVAFDPDYIPKIKSNPQLYKQFDEGVITREAIINELTDTMRMLEDAKSGTGAMYDDLRKAGGSVDVQPNWLLEKAASDLGLGVIDGKLTKLPGKGKAITAAEVKKINDMIFDLGNGSYSVDDFLERRKELAALARFDQITGSASPAFDKFAKDAYAEFNDLGRPQIEGLDKVDAEMSKLYDELTPIKDMLIDKKTGALKASFNEESLLKFIGKSDKAQTFVKHLNDLIPGFGDKVDMLRVYEAIENSSKAPVGQYAKGALLGGSMLGGPLAMAGAGVASVMLNPKNLAKRIANMAEKGAARVDDLPTSGKYTNDGIMNRTQDLNLNMTTKELKKKVVPSDYDNVEDFILAHQEQSGIIPTNTILHSSDGLLPKEVWISDVIDLKGLKRIMPDVENVKIKPSTSLKSPAAVDAGSINSIRVKENFFKKVSNSDVEKAYKDFVSDLVEKYGDDVDIDLLPEVEQKKFHDLESALDTNIGYILKDDAIPYIIHEIEHIKQNIKSRSSNGIGQETYKSIDELTAKYGEDFTNYGSLGSGRKVQYGDRSMPDYEIEAFLAMDRYKTVEELRKIWDESQKNK